MRFVIFLLLLFFSFFFCFSIFLVAFLVVIILSELASLCVLHLILDRYSEFIFLYASVEESIGILLGLVIGGKSWHMHGRRLRGFILVLLLLLVVVVEGLLRCLVLLSRWCLR